MSTYAYVESSFLLEIIETIASTEITRVLSRENCKKQHLAHRSVPSRICIMSTYAYVKSACFITYLLSRGALLAAGRDQIVDFHLITRPQLSIFYCTTRNYSIEIHVRYFSEFAFFEQISKQYNYFRNTSSAFDIYASKSTAA